eukprot:3901896-Pleurochrysis_carterae.AAC.1
MVNSAITVRIHHYLKSVPTSTLPRMPFKFAYAERTYISSTLVLHTSILRHAWYRKQLKLGKMCELEALEHKYAACSRRPPGGSVTAFSCLRA